MTVRRPATALLPRVFSVFLVFLAFLLASCGAAGAEREAPASPPPSSPEPFDDAAALAAFEALEAQLAAAENVHVAFTTESGGAVVSATRGVLETARSNRARFEATGEFQSRPIAPSLRSDGTRMVGGAERGRFDEDTPPGLNEALLVGLTRMGILHTVATVAGGTPPDRANGSVREWVTTQSHEAGQSREIDGQLVRGVRFEVLVAGAPAAEATLYLDAATGLPRERRQVVRFAEGEMEVVERYSEFRVDGALDEAAFVVDE